MMTYLHYFHMRTNLHIGILKPSVLVKILAPPEVALYLLTQYSTFSRSTTHREILRCGRGTVLQETQQAVKKATMMYLWSPHFLYIVQHTKQKLVED